MTALNLTVPIGFTNLATSLSEDPEKCGVLLNLLVLKWTTSIGLKTLDENIRAFAGEFLDGTVEAMEKAVSVYRELEAKP